jgi:hypothetical protein
VTLCPNHPDRRAHAGGVCRPCYDRARRNGKGPAPKATGPEKSGIVVDHETGEATITGPPLDPRVKGDLEELIRENGLDPDDWIVVTTTLNRWNGLGKADPETGENPIKTLRQIKVTLRLRPERIFPQSAVHVPALVKPKPVRITVDEPELILIEGDHQAPYTDMRLDACMTRATHELRPTEHIFLGDLGDYPAISKHPDHPAAMATVNDCIQASYDILRRRADASPNTRRRKAKGNHDWRPEAEILARAERMYGAVCADQGDGEREPLWSLRRALHLDALGVELVEDPRGWQHAEIELVPGPYGLVVRHGWLIGAGNAEKTLTKRGRSIIFGHVHTRQDVRRWDPSIGAERQATSIGAMCLVRDQRFPHFAVCDDWLQGAATVTRWRDGRWRIEHAEYADGSLTWRDRRWAAE